MPLSVLIEVKEFVARACEALKKAGAVNIIQLCASSEQLQLRHQQGLPAMLGASYDGGVKIAEKLLALPPAERPDGIVSDDDTIVSGLLAGLISAQMPQIDYLPRIATIIHRELGEKYPSDKMILFQQNIEEYATLAVELLLNVLRGDAPEEKQLLYRFTSVEQ